MAADWDNARRLYPSVDMGVEEISARLDADPDIMFHIIGDIYDAVMAERDKANGIVKMGRRPKREQVPLSEVWATIFPKPYSTKPFRETMVDLLAGRSQRAFARKVPCNQATLSRLINGQLEPELDMLEAIADAAGVGPHYFVEWRAKYMGELVTSVLMEQPRLSIGALQRFREAVPA